MKTRDFAEFYMRKYFEEGNYIGQNAVRKEKIFNDMVDPKIKNSLCAWGGFFILFERGRKYLGTQKRGAPLYIQCREDQTIPKIQSDVDKPKIIRTVYSICESPEDFRQTNVVIENSVKNMIRGMDNNEKRASEKEKQEKLGFFDTIKQMLDKDKKEGSN
jgi:hypothetical protein